MLLVASHKGTEDTENVNRRPETKVLPKVDHGTRQGPRVLLVD